jgi:Tfp pilus tip-associated adhesin PilY1
LQGWSEDNIDILWKASDTILSDPTTRNVWTIMDPADAGTVTRYLDGTLTDDNWLCKPLGDIINSTPIVVGPPPFFYKFDRYLEFKMNRFDRPHMVYVGSNDGLLHAFNLDTVEIDSDGKVVESGSSETLTAGDERWAFVPNSMHAKLDRVSDGDTYDMCTTGYCHQYMVDGNPIIADIAYDFDGKGYRDQNDWRTILVMGLRAGGQSYFALDITSGQDFDGANSAPAKHLWQFSDDPYLGQTWADPSIKRVLDVSDPHAEDMMWAAFFGSGYSPTGDPAKEAYIYGIQAHDAAMLWKDAQGIPTNKVKLSSANTIQRAYLKFKEKAVDFVVGEAILGIPSLAVGTIVSINETTMTFDLEGIVGEFIDDDNLTGSLGGHAKADGTLISIYSNDALSASLLVDLDADYYRIHDRIYTGNLYGNMYRISDIGKGQTPSVEVLFEVDHDTPNTSRELNPIRAQAAAAYQESKGDIWLYFGTGKYDEPGDKTNAQTQYFIGLKDWADDMYHPAVPKYDLDDLVTLEARLATGEVTIEGETVAFKYRTINNDNPYNDPFKIELYNNQSGWNGPSLIASERILVKPLVAGGIIYFVTFIPSENVCAGNGESWLFAVDYNTGLTPAEPVFDINADGKVDAKDKVDIDEQGDGIVPAGILIGLGQGSHPVMLDDHILVTTTGSGEDDSAAGGGGGGGGGLKNKRIDNRFRKVALRNWRQY